VFLFKEGVTQVVHDHCFATMQGGEIPSLLSMENGHYESEEGWMMVGFPHGFIMNF